MAKHDVDKGKAGKECSPERWLVRHLRAEGPRLAVGIGALVAASFVNFRTGAQLKAAIEAPPGANRGQALRSLALFGAGALAGCLRTYIFDSSSERLRAALAAEVFAARLRAEPARAAAAAGAEASDGTPSRCGSGAGLGEGAGARPAAAVDDGDVAACAELVLKLQNAARFTSSVVGGTFAMFFASWKLSLAIWPLLVTGSLRGARAGARRAGKAAERLATARESALGFAEERLQHRDLVRWFLRADDEAKEYRSRCNACVDLATKAARGRGIAHLVVDIAGKGVMLGLCKLGSVLVQRGELTAGELTSFFFHATFLGLGLFGLVNLAPELAVARGAASRLATVVGEGEAEAAKEGDEEPAGGKPVPVRFEDVFFDRQAGAKQVLKGFTLDVPAGSTCALIGTSGSGKSTALSLLLRDADAQRGRILIDGKDVREIPRPQLRSMLSVAPQQPALLGDSVREAVTFGLGRGAGSASASDVEAATRAACAHDFVAARPGGYDAPVGNGGELLSGGERQRLSLARALVRRAPVLLLDEPTSALDAATASALVDAVLAKRSGRPTTLVVTHSLALIRRCEQVAVLSAEGRVVQQGTFDRLVAEKDGPLARIMKAGELVDADDSSAARKS